MSAIENRRKIIILSLAGFVVACFFGWDLLRGRQPPNQGLCISEQDLELGRLWESNKHSIVVPIINRSASRIEVSDFAASCTCASITPRAFALNCGESIDLSIDLDLTRAGDRQPSDTERRFTFAIQPLIIASPPQQVGWQFSGTVVIPLALTPGRVDFGKLISQTTYEPLSVAVKSSVELIDLKATSAHNQFAITVDSKDKANGLYTIVIAPQQGLQPGPFDFIITLEAIRDSGERIPKSLLPVFGLVRQDLQCEPEILIFGARRIEETVNETVAIRSVSSKSFRILDIRAPSTVIVTPALVANPTAGEVYFNIAAQIRTPRDHKELVEFVVENDQGLEVTVPLSISYFGLPSIESNKKGN